MAKFTIVGDPHAKPDNLDKINSLFDQIEDLGNPCIILGDLLDTKEVVRGKCLNTYLKRIKNSKIERFYILVGNHDWFNLNCEEHALEALESLSNVVLVDEPMLITTNLAALPYIHDVNQLRSQLKELKGKNIVCHADIKGFDYGTGIVSKEGLDADELFFDFKQIISGHYHNYQSIRNITYLGTPFSHSFGESNQIKYLGIFDDSTGKLELLTMGFPRHITLHVNCDLGESSPGTPLNDYVRVILHGRKDSIKAHLRVPGIKYIEVEESSGKVGLINESQSPQLQFEKWAKEIKKYDDKLISLGLGILNDV